MHFYLHSLCQQQSAWMHLQCKPKLLWNMRKKPKLMYYAFLLYGIKTISLTSFAGSSVLAVLCPVSLDNLPFSVVSLDGEVHAQDVVAGLDDPEDPPHTQSLLLRRLPGLQVLHQLVFHNSSAAIEEALHHPEEVRVIFLVSGIAVVTHPQQGWGSRQSGLEASRGQSVTRSASQQLPEIPVHSDKGLWKLRYNGERRNLKMMVIRRGEKGNKKGGIWTRLRKLPSLPRSVSKVTGLMPFRALKGSGVFGGVAPADARSEEGGGNAPATFESRILSATFNIDIILLRNNSQASPSLEYCLWT